jgi:NarL family two-component system sensor histidine kinase LiaS
VVEERHRLARDLHDSVKQQLFAVDAAGQCASGRAGAAQTSARWPKVEEIARQAQRGAGLIRALRPVALAAKGLCAAVRLASDWSWRTGIAVTVRRRAI